MSSRFHYKAVDRSGDLTTGTLEADSAAGVLVALDRQRLVPIEVSLSAPSMISFKFGRKPTLSSRELLSFTYGLSSLLKAGLLLDGALRIISRTSERPRIRTLCAMLEERIRSGASLTDAMTTGTQDFPRYYLTMVQAGELGGSLAAGLDRLGTFVERGAKVRERIISSLIYPAMLAAMMILTLILVLTVVLPKFRSLFDEAGVQLPLPTQFVMALGEFFQAYGWLLVISIVVGIAAFIGAWRSPTVGPQLSLRLLTTWWTFGLIGQIQTSRFLRAIGVLMKNGVPLPQATGVALGMVENVALRSAAQATHVGLKEGHHLSELLDQAKVFPKVSVQLARVGEETGRLDDMLVEAADVLDRESQEKIDRLLSIFVPTTTIVMGALVAGLIASVLVGILSLNDLAF